MKNSTEKKTTKPSIWWLIKTTLAAFVGVQTNANREQDFSQSSPLPYIVMGIIFTVVFLGTLMMVANYAIGE